MIIISNNFIKATRVVLPINNQSKISVKYGLRHRAAVSITEKTDAVAIVVSEENGKMLCRRQRDCILLGKICLSG